VKLVTEAVIVKTCLVEIYSKLKLYCGTVYFFQWNWWKALIENGQRWMKIWSGHRKYESGNMLNEKSGEVEASWESGEINEQQSHLDMVP